MDEDELRIDRLHAVQMKFLREDCTPDDWHRYAWHHNWDDRLDGLYWIVSQPKCDRATAILTFWKGEPTGHEYENETKTKEMGEGLYDVELLLRYISQRLNTIGYERAEIAYDFLLDHGCDMPEYHAMIEAGRLRDIQELIERQKGLTDQSARLHPDLQRLHVDGRKVGGFDDDNDFYEMFPSDLEQDDMERGGSIAAQLQDQSPHAGLDENDAASMGGNASARVRALRRTLDAGGAVDAGGKDQSSLPNWFRRLLGR